MEPLPVTRPGEDDLDVFAGIEDDPIQTPGQDLAELLTRARRGWVPIRKTFVQQPRGSQTRAGALSEFVNGRQHRALDAFLLVHALLPIHERTPIALSTWARIMSTRTPCSVNTAAKAFRWLAGRGLLVRGQQNRRPTFTPLREDGSRRPYARHVAPSSDGDPGYFCLPHTYWTQGHADRLQLPGKAMLLIMLAETQKPGQRAFAMPVERAADWYGISERTAERGYRELDRAGLLKIKKQKVADPLHPAGRREVYWRALTYPFSTDERIRLQAASRPDALSPAPPQVPVQPPQPVAADPDPFDVYEELTVLGQNPEAAWSQA